MYDSINQYKISILVSKNKVYWLVQYIKYTFITMSSKCKNNWIFAKEMSLSIV